jgi:putative hydrolase of the HAD superfamily
MIRAILFDLDDTLADRRRAFRRYCLDCCRRYAPAGSLGQWCNLVRQMVARDENGYAPRERYCEWLASQFSHAELSADHLWNDHRERFSEFFSPIPAVRALIDRLAARYRLAVVTNGSSASQRAKLQRTELADRIPHIFISGELGVAKPQPEIFESALAACECSADEALFVGDHPENDIAGAMQLGMRSCWVAGRRTYPPGLPTPTWTVNRVTELEAVLP